MRVHLIDGTYELFRYHFALRSHINAQGQEVAATRGVIRSMLSLIRDGATHIAIATDSVIESWRNEIYDGYKTGAGTPPELLSQFPLLEQGLSLAGFTVWPMVEYEADDALAAAAKIAYDDMRVRQVLICTPDKDLAQCVTEDTKVVQFNRSKEQLIDHQTVIEKFGVEPASIPDYLALVGDSADGFPGLKGWGAKSSAIVLSRYKHLENIPRASGQWDIAVRGATKLCATFDENYDEALLFRKLATLDSDGPNIGNVDSMAYRGPQPGFDQFCHDIDLKLN